MKLYTALISGVLLAALQNTAFALVTLSVNTVNDEFGENLANCSLREAIESINTRSAFGGCISGQRHGTNVVQLEAAEYQLTRGELAIKEAMTIQGKGADSTLIDGITNSKPKRQAPSTIINAQQKSRVFNSSSHKAALSLNNLKLINGSHDDIGGAVLAGGGLTLFNTVFESNIAKNMGGALYLTGKDATLTSTDSTWRNNQVTQGTGAALAMTCLDDLTPTTRTVDILRNSFVQNGNSGAQSIIEACGLVTVNLKTSTIGENTAATSGAIINFNDKTSTQSSIIIESSTIIKNLQASVLNFNQINTVAIGYSVLAFNEGVACQSNNSSMQYIGNYNLFQNCDKLKAATGTATNPHAEDTHIPSLSPVQFSNEFNLLGNYGGYTPTYLPKNSSEYVLNKAGFCTEKLDQRESIYAISILCDRGSVERRIALSVVDTTNIFSNKNKSDRIAEVNVLANDIPSETDLTDEKPDARGKIAKDASGKYLLELVSDSNGSCSIIHLTDKESLPLVRYDNGGRVQPDTQKASCKYTFTDSNGNKAIVGELLFKIENKLPKANADSFFLASGSSSVAMNVAANDNDEDDGKYGGLCTENTVKCNGGYYIRVVSSPSLGIIEGDSRECPDHSEANKYICYRGNLTYRPKNTLAPFNDSFTYVVYDTDLGVSPEATVTVINENAQIAEQNSSGSITWLSILTLAGMVIYRRRKSHIV